MMKYHKTIQTKRLVLRPWEDDDAYECFKIARNPRIGPACGWVPHKSLDESRKIVRDVLMVPGNYAIQLKDGALIGNIGFKKGDVMENDRQREIGCWLDESYWHYGYMSEALQALIDEAFTHLRLEALWYDCYSDNKRSERVALRNGFIIDHVIRHHYVSGVKSYKDLICLKLNGKS